MEDTRKYYLRPSGKGIRLHLGAGDYWLEGFLNIDHATLGGTDMILDLKQPLPFQDGVVEEIQTHDFIEHFTPEEISTMLDDWYRVLIPGGKIVATLPNLDGLMEMYRATYTYPAIQPDEEHQRLIIQAIYGIEKDHRWGYNANTLKKLFEEHGFTAEVFEVVTDKDQFPRLEAQVVKP